MMSSCNNHVVIYHHIQCICGVFMTGGYLHRHFTRYPDFEILSMTLYSIPFHSKVKYDRR